MKIYLISQSVNNDYDTYDSAVVVAENEEEARKMHPSNGKDITQKGGVLVEEYYNPNYGWVSDPYLVSVELLGEAKIGLSGIICASFNAG